MIVTTASGDVNVTQVANTMEPAALTTTNTVVSITSSYPRGSLLTSDYTVTQIETFGYLLASHYTGGQANVKITLAL